LRKAWSLSVIEEAKSDYEIIQRAAQVITNLTNENGTEAWNHKCLGISPPYDAVRRIGVILGLEAVAFRQSERGKGSIQIDKVFFCPGYTKESAMEAVTGCGSLHG